MKKKFSVLTESATLYFDDLSRAERYARIVHEKTGERCIVYRCEQITAFGEGGRVTIQPQQNA